MDINEFIMSWLPTNRRVRILVVTAIAAFLAMGLALIITWLFSSSDNETNKKESNLSSTNSNTTNKNTKVKAKSKGSNSYLQNNFVRLANDLDDEYEEEDSSVEIQEDYKPIVKNENTEDSYFAISTWSAGGLVFSAVIIIIAAVLLFSEKARELVKSKWKGFIGLFVSTDKKEDTEIIVEDKTGDSKGEPTGDDDAESSKKKRQTELGKILEQISTGKVATTKKTLETTKKTQKTVKA